jgi:hypothetical protein
MHNVRDVLILDNYNKSMGQGGLTDTSVAPETRLGLGATSLGNGLRSSVRRGINWRRYRLPRLVAGYVG